MIVSSKLCDDKYFWIKIPRTATKSYARLFFPQYYTNKTELLHTHTPMFFPQNIFGVWLEEMPICDNPIKTIQGFSLVRNPYQRFISSMKYIVATYNQFQTHREEKNKPEIEYKIISMCDYCGKINNEYTTSQKIKSVAKTNSNIFNFWKDEDTFYSFMYDHFNKNCEIKNNLYASEIFRVQNPVFTTAFFITQTRFAYHPKIKTFKYEDLSKFNSWIEHVLGYDTSNLIKYNSSSDVRINIDFTTKRFKQLVQYLFYDDFKVFGYDT